MELKLPRGKQVVYQELLITLTQLYLYLIIEDRHFRKKKIYNEIKKCGALKLYNINLLPC